MKYAQRVLQNDLTLPELPSMMETQRTEVLASNDHFFGWLQSECLVGPAAAGAEEFLEVLKDRYEKFLARSSKEQGGGFIADKISMKAFKAYLRDRGVRVTDQNGNPLRKEQRSSNGIRVDSYYATGIQLKLRTVA
jgi:hypothetical protein